MNKWKRNHSSCPKRYTWGKGVPSLRANFEYDNLIAEIRVEKGLSQKKLAEEIGVAYATIANIENGIISPFIYSKKIGYSVKPWINKLSEILECDLADLFPRDICDIEKSNYTDEQIIDLFHNGSKNNNLAGIDVVINRLFATLTPREVKILKEIFWEGRSLRDIGESEKVSAEMIRHVVSKALRKLRHPSRSKYLRRYLDISNG
jgi:transcriptional regulator with XRE-family HTH domain